MVVRVAKAFRDYDDQTVGPGEILHVADVSFFPYDDGSTIRAEKTIRLSGNVDENARIIDNPANEYFEPLPEQSCILACIELVNSYWLLPAVANAPHAAEMCADLDCCLSWVSSQSGEFPPDCASATIRRRIFPDAAGTADLHSALFRTDTAFSRG
ncbi:hypothetical protein Acid345_3677 [Candidatus Koribacter versatilis Ellin345]|uniref:Uncharacterized protein n=1 Tax=Koribacter versatilis (strain Ellin345) TaxID=204669 RepID=Q1IKC2_KORVE|nr:hypothetical protein Acid345_3677 [Candidatus Koribacter versatilis Ellin345]